MDNGMKLEQDKKAAGGCLLNPLQQRLLFYRFAVVEIEPQRAISPARWGLPYLQRLGDRAGWKRLLANCLPFRELGQEAVISPSLAALRAVRRCQPRRPLILCRAAFETMAMQSTLQPLIRRGHPLCKLMSREDATTSLHWLSEMPQPAGTEVNAYQSLKEHPLKQMRQHRLSINPASSYSYREDGMLLEQLALFSASKPVTKFEALLQLLAALERDYRHQLSRIRHHWYVFAQDRELLKWFRRDCLRLLPLRHRCLDHPNEPHPADPFTYYLLVHDPQVKLARLREGLPCLHLDGNPRKRLYRAIRQASGLPDWVSTRTPRISARYVTTRGVFRFQRRQAGWCCHNGGPEAEQDESSAFSVSTLVQKYLET